MHESQQGLQEWGLILDTILLWTSDAPKQIITIQSAPNATPEACSWGTRKKMTLKNQYSFHNTDSQKQNIELGYKMLCRLFLHIYFKEKLPYHFINLFEF